MRSYISFMCIALALLLTQSFPIVRKKGIPISYRNCAAIAAIGASWAFNFETDTANCPGTENVPMIHGEYDLNWQLSGNSPWVMGFNEPDLDLGNLIPPARAAQLWRQIEQKYPAKKMLAPAPSNNADGYSTNPKWLMDFRNEYIEAYGGAPRLDGLAVHCYRQYAADCIALTKDYLNLAADWNVQQVWVTEFSFCINSAWCTGADAKQSVREMETFIRWMEDEPRVTRYAWFATQYQKTEVGADPRYYTPLFDWNTGELTLWGKAYLPYR